MKMLKNLLVVGFTVGALVGLSGCEDDESNNLAKAQACLDKITSANYDDASLCLGYVEQYDSQQANILKCSIYMVDGGLTTDKVTEAYKKLSATADDAKEAAFISVLAMAPGKASAALPYCKKSELKGFIYLANLAVVGSLMADTLAGIGYDPANPNDIPDSTDVDNMIAACQPGAAPTNPCDHAAIGEALETVGEQYCTGSNVDSDICKDLADAITAFPASPENIAKQLFCQFNTPPQNYDSVGDVCN